MEKIYQDPFPHMIIDNYLPKSEFLELRESIKHHKNNYLKEESALFTQNKDQVHFDSIDNKLKEMLKNLCSEAVLKKISSLSGINYKKLIGLGDIQKFGGYSPYHITPSGGFLGSHVDHSQINSNGENLMHIANSIFYISENWEEAWGGQTALFSQSGLRLKKLIEPKPNRLIMFLHSAISFHGVVRYSKDASLPRETIYNDYYIKEEDVPEYLISLKSKWNKEYLLTSHKTTCLPIIRFGVRNFFKKSSLINFFREIKTSRGMYKNYAYYLFNKLLKRRIHKLPRIPFGK